MTLLKDIKTALVVTGFFTVLLCGLYPLIVTAVGHILFSHQAEGSLLYDKEGHLLGSSLIGQNFNGEQYFHPRPSAAGAAGYDATASGGTNYGPTSQKLIDSVKQRVIDYRKDNNLPEDQAVPADAVTSSASGLDPHITLQNALLQASRVAVKRGLSPEQVRSLISRHTDSASLGILGESGINTVTLNLALDGKIE